MSFKKHNASVGEGINWIKLEDTLQRGKEDFKITQLGRFYSDMFWSLNVDGVRPVSRLKTKLKVDLELKPLS
jgi:hypothetical protein